MEEPVSLRRWLMLLAVVSGCLSGPGLARAAPPVYLQLRPARKAAAHDGLSPSAGRLVLNAMPEAERARLADALSGLAAAAARSRNPFYVAIDDDPNQATVRQWAATTAPAFTAATSLAAGAWPSPEGDATVLPVARCSAGLACVPVEGKPGDDPTERRIRFLAWPLGHAVLLSVDDESARAKLVEALRTPASPHVALVLTSDELHTLRASPALPRLLGAAKRLLPTLPPTQARLRETLASLARANAGKDGLSWLRLPPSTILVVPRLGALATSDRLVADVETRLRAAGTGAKVRWLASPR